MRVHTLSALLILVSCHVMAADTPKVPADKTLEGIENVRIIVRAQGPYDAEVPLQVVCYFKHKPGGDTTRGAAVELDKRLHGAIASLRDSGEFAGDELETMLFTSPADTIKPKHLLLVGLGSEDSLSLETMERIGRTALRCGADLGIDRIAFAPLLRDQGNDKLAVGDVESAVIRGMLKAYATQRKLQKEGLAHEFALKEWIVEAGPVFFNDTVAGVEKGIRQAKESMKTR